MMYALADRVHFQVREERGTIVTLEKRFGSQFGEPVLTSDIPGQLRARVEAACGHPSQLVVRQREIGEGMCGFEVFAATGDRLVVMELAERSDGSVFEQTRTHTAAEIDRVDRRGDLAAVTTTTGPTDVPLMVPFTVIEAVRGLF